jgi:hypothetical protein
MMSSPRQLKARHENVIENEKGYDIEPLEKPELTTYDLEDNMDTDPVGTPLYEDAEGRDFVPKTMQQMAEDAAKREMEQGDDEDGRHDATGLNRVVMREATEPISTSGAKSTGRVTRLRSGAIKSGAISNPGLLEALKTPRGGRSSVSRSKAAGSANGTRRKRRRGESESEDDARTSQGEEMDVSDEFGVDDEDEGKEEDDDDDDSELDHRGPRKVPHKRSRNGRTANMSTKRKAKIQSASAALAVSAPTMTLGGDAAAGTSRRASLRPRMSKVG